MPCRWWPTSCATTQARDRLAGRSLPFAAIPQMHPGRAACAPMAWRKWRGQLLQAPPGHHAHAAPRPARGRYDLVLDLQGLLKSALWARQAGAPVAGYDRASAREPAGRWLLPTHAAVPRDLHAVQRCRRWPRRTWVMRCRTAARVRPAAPRRLGAAGSLCGADPQCQPPEKLWPERIGWRWASACVEWAGPRWCCGARPGGADPGRTHRRQLRR
jgi:heptosyltransferase-1